MHGGTRKLGAGGTTYVAHPADPAAYGMQASKGNRYVEFDVPADLLRSAGKKGGRRFPDLIHSMIDWQLREGADTLVPARQEH